MEPITEKSSLSKVQKESEETYAQEMLVKDQLRWEQLQRTQSELHDVVKMGDIEQVKKYLSKYRELLHAYNETKDTAILLLSKIAEMEQVPISEIHSRYSANFEKPL